MKATIESTDEIATFVINGVDVPARVWKGTTEQGVPFLLFGTRVAVDEGKNAEEFDRELRRVATPAMERKLVSFDYRMVI